MSIIQEALKKVQRRPENILEDQEVLKEDVSGETFEVASYPQRDNSVSASSSFQEKRRAPLLPVLLAIFFAIAAYYIFQQVFPQAKNNKTLKKEDGVAAANKTAIEEKSAGSTSEPAYLAPNIAPVKAQESIYVLNGIMVLESGSRAIINGSVVEEGETVRGAVVETIEKEKVFLNRKGEKIVLRLK